jgi:hypothetical protein
MRKGGGDEEVDDGSSRAEETAMATEVSITETLLNLNTKEITSTLALDQFAYHEWNGVPWLVNSQFELLPSSLSPSSLESTNRVPIQLAATHKQVPAKKGPELLRQIPLESPQLRPGAGDMLANNETAARLQKAVQRIDGSLMVRDSTEDSGANNGVEHAFRGIAIGPQQPFLGQTRNQACGLCPTRQFLVLFSQTSRVNVPLEFRVHVNRRFGAVSLVDEIGIESCDKASGSRAKVQDGSLGRCKHFESVSSQSLGHGLSDLAPQSRELRCS